jgi:MATE family multidrug resistance protein
LVSRNYTYEEQAVSQTMRNLFGLGGVFSWAFGSSANTIISNLIGQGRQEEIFAIIKKMVIISVSGMSIFVVIAQFVSWFISWPFWVNQEIL